MSLTASDRSVPAESDWQYRELVRVARRAGVPDDKLARILDALHPAYYGYDAKAALAQRRFRRGAAAVYCLSASAVMVAIGQLLFAPALQAAVALEVLAMAAALLLLIEGHRRQWKRRWLENRYAAEQLRIRMYLSVVPPRGDAPPGEGEALDPSDMLPFYNQLGAKLPGDAERAITDSRLAGCAVENLPVLKNWVGDGWIASQISFHEKTARRKRRSARMARRATIGLFALTLIAALLHAGGFGHRGPYEGPIQNTLATSLIIFLSIALPAIASAVHAINDLLDHERIAVRSDGMASILGHLSNEIKEARTVDQVVDLARKTEQVMAIENFEWLAALMFRQPPHAPV